MVDNDTRVNFCEILRPMAEMSDRKKRIMEHLARTRGNYLAPAAAAPAERKQQIMDHVKRTKG